MDFVETKLREWGFERFIKDFQDNEIDEDSFLLLDDESLKDLIKPIGPRLKFKTELAHLKLTREDGKVLDDSGSTTDESSEEVPVSTVGSTPAPIGSASSQRKVRQEPPVFAGQKGARIDYNIKDILRDTFGGEDLVTEMDTGLLSFRSRKKIVNTLVSHIIEHHGKHPRSDVKLAMAKAIVQEFPKLDNEDGDGYTAWFTPGCGKHDSSGFLENRIRNVRRRDPDKTVSAGPSTSKQTKLIDTINLDLSSDDLDEANVAAMVTWLKYHNTPLEQVAEMMGKTCKARAAWIRAEKEKTVRELIQEYPRLIDTDGMIDQDFRILFPEASNAFFLNWTKNVQKLEDYAVKQVNWRHLLRFSGKLDTDEQKSNLCLQMLPLLFPPGMKRRDGRKGPNVHATVAEASKSFFQVEKIGTNIPAFLENVRQTQPFVLAIGPRESPEQVFVICERQTIKCNSLLKGVDTCFKLIYILDINYPWECQHVWDFIQKFFYGIGQGKGREKCVPSVSLLINYLTTNADKDDDD